VSDPGANHSLLHKPTQHRRTFCESSAFTSDLEGSSRSFPFNNQLSPKDVLNEPQLVHLMWSLNLSLKSESV